MESGFKSNALHGSCDCRKASSCARDTDAAGRKSVRSSSTLMKPISSDAPNKRLEHDARLGAENSECIGNPPTGLSGKCVRADANSHEERFTPTNPDPKPGSSALTRTCKEGRAGRIFCHECFVVIPKPWPNQKFCKACGIEHERERARERARKQRREERRRIPNFSNRVIKNNAELKQLKAQIPTDTRDLTGRFMGDPLPTRSALDKMSPEAIRKLRWEFKW